MRWTCSGWTRAGLTALDVGASTGGFTDCLLQRGAARVSCVDVGQGQLDWKIASDPRVRVLDKVNIRLAPPDLLPERVDLIVIDVSFISLRLVLPVLPAFAKPGAPLIALVKPQFEVGRAAVGKGGIVRDEAARARALAEVRAAAVADWLHGHRGHRLAHHRRQGQHRIPAVPARPRRRTIGAVGPGRSAPHAHPRHWRRRIHWITSLRAPVRARRSGCGSRQLRRFLSARAVKDRTWRRPAR